MIGIKKINLLAILFLSTLALKAQDTEKVLSLDKGPLDSQFEYVLSESNNYQDYKVIKEDWLVKLRKHVTDSINSLKTQIQQTKAQLAQERNEMREMQQHLQAISDTLTQVRQAQNSIGFVGAQVQKSAYQVIMWSIVAVLLILLITFIYRFNNSNAVTHQARQDLEEMREEFEDHRKKALEYQQQLRRQLQDEINKQRGVK